MMHAKNSAQQPPEFLVVGRVIRPHSMRGALIVQALSSMINAIPPGSKILVGDPPNEEKIDDIRPHRDRYLMSLSGCSTRDEAERFRGAEIRLRFEDVDPLPDGEYYHWQILGLQVATQAGQPLGEVVQILETGANDVYIVRAADGKEQLLPAIKPVIKIIDLEAGNLIVELLPGLLDE
jgi:16S rRNA processing protein RimM